MSTLLVVRHGQSTWNAAGRWQGHEDPPLSPLGVRQAQAAAEGLGAVDGIWSSTLERARHTAELLAGPSGRSVVADERLMERDAGEWTGRTRPEIEEIWPGWLAEGRRPPGFEVDDVLVVRALAVLNEIGTALAGGQGLVVSHGGLIRAVERHLGVDSPALSNLEGRLLRWQGGRLTAGERVLLLDPDAVEVTTPRQI